MENQVKQESTETKVERIQELLEQERAVAGVAYSTDVYAE